MYMYLTYTTTSLGSTKQHYILHAKRNLNMLIHMRIKIFSNKEVVAGLARRTPATSNRTNGAPPIAPGGVAQPSDGDVARPVERPGDDDGI
jgi:hypothetical protein